MRLPQTQKLPIMVLRLLDEVTSTSRIKERHRMRKIKNLLVEDNRIIRDGIRAIINKQVDLKTVGALEGNRDTILQVRKLKPHVVLIDLGLRNESGLRIVAKLNSEMPQTKVIGMGLIPSQQDVIEFVKAGAMGFILKDAQVEDFLGTIRSVAGGTRILPPLLAGSLFTHVVNLAIQRG